MNATNWFSSGFWWWRDFQLKLERFGITWLCFQINQMLLLSNWNPHIVCLFCTYMHEEQSFYFFSLAGTWPASRKIYWSFDGGTNNKLVFFYLVHVILSPYYDTLSQFGLAFIPPLFCLFFLPHSLPSLSLSLFLRYAIPLPLLLLVVFFFRSMLTV